MLWIGIYVALTVAASYMALCLGFQGNDKSADEQKDLMDPRLSL